MNTLVGRVKTSTDPESGPVEGGCTPVNVAGAEAATARDYFETVTKALGIEPVWDDEPAWTGGGVRRVPPPCARWSVRVTGGRAAAA